MGAFSAITRRGRRRTLRDVAIAAASNVATHTIFWYTFRRMGPTTAARLWGFEIIIVLVEAMVYRALCRIPLWRAVAISLLLNLASYLLGIFVWDWI